MNSARELIVDWRSDDKELAGMQDRTLVFIGDSTFGNFSGSLAITGVVEEFTDARVINCGYGGMAAAYGDPECPALGDLLEAIEQGDGSGIGWEGAVRRRHRQQRKSDNLRIQGRRRLSFWILG